MTAKVKKSAWKATVVIISILLIVVTAVIAFIIIFTKEDKTEVTSISKIEILLLKDTSVVTIDFDFKEVYWASFQSEYSEESITDSTSFYVDNTKLNDYYNFWMDFYIELEKQTYHDTKKNSVNDDSPYWIITITNQDSKQLITTGITAYPKNWDMLIEKTNILIGDDILSKNTYGLALQ